MMQRVEGWVYNDMGGVVIISDVFDGCVILTVLVVGS
jgi:hypothetical protein